MNLTVKDTSALRKAYEDAYRLTLESFVFENSLGQTAELSTNYAEYLLEYLESLTKGDTHDRAN